MSEVFDPVGAAPETHSVRFLTLLFGACAAPIVWLGQLMLGYGVSAYVCYPGDHPQSLIATGPLFSALMVFDVVALIVCAASGLISWRAWRRSTSDKAHGSRHVLHTGEGRDRFLALWGIMSSLWFFAAILFNVIASVTVPPCLG
jgi:CRISPR-associated DxTHG motif protein